MCNRRYGVDSKEAIIQATMKLIEENGEHLEEITVREICKRAGVGLGLVNYHFGNKDKLIEQCVERMINGIVTYALCKTGISRQYDA